MPCPRPPLPTLAGLQDFVYSVMGIPQAAMPPDSEWLAWSLEVACSTVSKKLLRAPGPTYLRAVYNYAGDYLVQWAPDQKGVYYPTNNPPNDNGTKLLYFAYLRQQWNLTGFVAGVIASSGDETTNQSMEVPEAFKNLTIGDLQQLKTPWGRAYLAIAQDIGTLWGIS